MHEGAQALVCGLGVVLELILCVRVARSLMRRVDEGKQGRFSATFVQAAAAIPLGITPVLFVWCAALVLRPFGVALLGHGPEAPGIFVAVAIAGVPIALLAAGVFAVVMLLQAVGGGRAADPSTKSFLTSKDCFPDRPPTLPRVDQRRQ